MSSQDTEESQRKGKSEKALRPPPPKGGEQSGVLEGVVPSCQYLNTTRVVLKILKEEGKLLPPDATILNADFDLRDRRRFEGEGKLTKFLGMGMGSQIGRFHQRALEGFRSC